MVERAFLTPKLVDQAEPPPKGERWIADTKQRGFGLRLWRTRSGEPRKAYCIRASDKFGKSKRLTFDHWRIAYENHYWDWEISRRLGDTENSFPPSLGELLPDAREWARDEIDRLKGRPTLQDEEQRQREAISVPIANVTLARFADAVLEHMELAGRTESYRDRLRKLFHQNLPQNLKQMPVSAISRSDLVSFIETLKISPGNLRVLRPFLRQIFSFEAGLRRDVSELDRMGNRIKFTINEQNDDNPLSHWCQADFEDFFFALEEENAYWQQALCLRMYLSFSKAPLSRVMSAKWGELMHVQYRYRYDPSREHFWRREWWYSNKQRASEKITIKQNMLLDQILAFCHSYFPKSEYWFPSHLGKSVGHIRSVDHVWQSALHGTDIRLTPRAFRKFYHELRRRGGWWSATDRLFVPDQG